MIKYFFAVAFFLFVTKVFSSNYTPGSVIAGMTVCTEHSHCVSVAANTGCYRIDNESIPTNSLNGSWGTKKDIGQSCINDSQCRSNNCNDEPQCIKYVDNDSSKGCEEYNDNKTCRELKVCRFASVGEQVVGSIRCEGNAFPDATNTCVSPGMLIEDQGSITADTININPLNCGLEISPDLQALRSISNLDLRVLEFMFAKPFLGDDTDCFGVTKGIKYITEKLKVQRNENDLKLQRSIIEQKEKFNMTVNQDVNMHNKLEVDRFLQALEVLTKNNLTYIGMNQSLIDSLNNALNNFTNLDNYYYSFTWGEDAVGDTPNRTTEVYLEPGHYRVAVRGPRDYCRGRSPYMKNSWKRQYVITGKIPDDLVRGGPASDTVSGPNGSSIKVPRPYSLVGTDLPNDNSYSEGTNSTGLIGFMYSGTKAYLDPVLPYYWSGSEFSKFAYASDTYNPDVKKKINEEMMGYMVNEVYLKMLDEFIHDPAIAEFPAADKAILIQHYKNWYSNDNLKNYKKFSVIPLIDATSMHSRSKDNAKKLFDQLFYARYKWFQLFHFYSYNLNDHHPVDARGTFFPHIRDRLSKFSHYHEKLNEALAKSNECLAEKKIQYSAQTLATDALGNGSNFDPKANNPKSFNPKTGSTTLSNCKSGNCQAINAGLGDITGGGNLLGGTTNKGSQASTKQSSAGHTASGQTNSAALEAKKKREKIFMGLAPKQKEKIIERQKEIANDLPLMIQSKAFSSFDGVGVKGIDVASVAKNADQKDIKNIVDKEKSYNQKNYPSGQSGYSNYQDSYSPSATTIGEEQIAKDQIIRESESEEYKTSDRDSLFTIVSKTYVRSYKRILENKKADEKLHDEFVIPAKKKAKGD